MVTINELHIASDADRQSGLLSDRAERDMEEVLNEYGAPGTDAAPDRESSYQAISFGYGIPMAGVRYYMIARER